MNYFDEKYKSETISEQSFSFNDMNMKGQDCSMPSQMGCCTPIYECPQERVCHRYICYEVPHIMPCNTRIINHHIYKHTFKPEYTCCEENVCENIYSTNNCC